MDMQKIIRVMIRIAAVLMGISILLLLLSVPLQGFIAKHFDYPAYIVSALPIFPFMQFLFCLLGTGCIALLITCCGKEKGGIWLEILVLVLLAIVLPVLNNLALPIYMSFMGRFGELKIAAYSAASQITTYCLTPAALGQVLAYVSCGMSIAYKKMSKKQEKTLNTPETGHNIQPL